ncbi:MAG: YbdK family carboxylate-amine ligase [Leptolyngbyaceae cyanobacterium MO_188.B28]|nr:YbdK family carboxylate-amine ligase [Leptolyngbyaceae cyanobacterium MO_188.B28]
MQFKGSPQATLGMELELQLLDPKTLDLVDGILPLMAEYPPCPWIKPEYNQATVEIISKVCSNIEELEAHTYSVLATLQARCQALGMTLCGAGTHPFCNRLVAMTPLTRHLDQYEMAGYSAHLVTFAEHVHVGMLSGDEAVEIMGRLKPYLPVLLALSASSPFWWGHDTRYVSYRQRLLASRQTYGIPPRFKTWREFTEFFDSAKYAKIVDTIRDLHWDLRLQPDLGTLEVRVMDAQPTLKESIMLAAFVHMLIVYLQCCCRGRKSGFLLAPHHWCLEKENYFRASRLGLEANYIEDEQGHSRPIKAVITDILEALNTTADQLGETKYLNLVKKHLESMPSYLRQRQIFQRSQSVKAVVASLVRELQEETPRFPIFPLPVYIRGDEAQNYVTSQYCCGLPDFS